MKCWCECFTAPKKKKNYSDEEIEGKRIIPDLYLGINTLILFSVMKGWKKKYYIEENLYR